LEPHQLSARGSEWRNRMIAPFTDKEGEKPTGAGRVQCQVTYSRKQSGLVEDPSKTGKSRTSAARRCRETQPTPGDGCSSKEVERGKVHSGGCTHVGLLTLGTAKAIPSGIKFLVASMIDRKNDRKTSESCRRIREGRKTPDMRG